MMKYLPLAVILGLTGCAGADDSLSEPGRLGMANPASQYCLTQGGTLSPVHNDKGESNNCKLPGGELIDEWALFRRDHPQPAP